MKISDEFRFCGMTLTIDTAGNNPTTAATIFNRMTPFQLGVHFDATEQTQAVANPNLNPGTADEVGCDAGSAGFNIYYRQMAC